MIEVGSLCIKIAGRSAGSYCVVVDKIDETFVLIDGNVKRKKCNIKHLEPIGIVLKIRKGASTSHVHDAMKKEKIKIISTKPRVKTSEKPLKQRKKKVKADKPVEKKPKKAKK